MKYVIRNIALGASFFHLSMLSNNGPEHWKMAEIEGHNSYYPGMAHQDGVPFDQTDAYRALEAAIARRRQRVMLHCFGECMRIFTRMSACVGFFAKEKIDD